MDTPVSLRMAGFEEGYAEGSFLWIVNNIYFQYYSLLIFLVSVGVMIGVSYLSEAPPDKQIEGLTYATVTEEHRRAIALELEPLGCCQLRRCLGPHCDCVSLLHRVTTSGSASQVSQRETLPFCRNLPRSV